MKRLFAIWRLGRFVWENREELMNDILRAGDGGTPVTWYRPEKNALSALFAALVSEGEESRQ